VKTLVSSLKVDHRYSPPWWQSLICLPDDPVKTIVGREGQFFLDFGSGGPRNFQTCLQLEYGEGAEWIGQELPDASIPMLVTRKTLNGLSIEETSFLEIPSGSEAKAVRYDGFETLHNWASPKIPCDPAFRDAAVRYPSGSHEASLEVHLQVEPYGSRTVALGFCEGRQTKPGLRRSIALVEGTAPLEIDPVRDFGANVPGVYSFRAKDIDGDGRILISLKFHPDTHFSIDTDRLSDLRTIMLSALWSFVGEAPAGERIVSGEANGEAEFFSPGRDLLLPHRRNHIFVSLTNTGAKPTTGHPRLLIKGVQAPSGQSDVVHVGHHNLVGATVTFGDVVELETETRDVAIESAGIQGTGGKSWSVALDWPSIQPGETREFALVVERFARSAPQRVTVWDSATALKKCVAWWKSNGPCRNVIEVPDAGVQATVDSCLRNIFQARDERNGLPSFHVGPTIYRGLFLADGAFMLELATILNRVDESRAGLEYLKSFELPEGGFNVIDTYYKENGIAAFAIIRHAQLTHDRQWLKSNWATIRGCVGRIRELRRNTPRGAANEGLLPSGAFCDGGVFNNGRPFADYSNVVWCLSGLKWAIAAADWVGELEDAANWQVEFDDFWSHFRQAAAKDMRDDGKGNLYLPVVQGNGDNHAPSRGQWAFCHSVYPGGIYPTGDPLVDGNLAMLRDAMVEGVVLDTGWMAGGLWPYFSSFYAHAVQWIGRGHEVPQLLYDFANHSSPTLVWREEQKPQGHGYEEVGDMPHNWASAEFLRMILHMLQLDRGEELHLLEGFPEQWSAPGDRTRLRGVRTPFGLIDLEVEGRPDGVGLSLRFEDPSYLPSKIFVHGKSWGGVELLELPVSNLVTTVVPRTR
jgi:hypothetical protein